MKTREDAVLWLQERGLFAKTRDWSLGQSVCAWSSQEIDPRSGITVCHNLIYIYPEDGVWLLMDPSTNPPITKFCGSLALATAQAAKMLGLQDDGQA